MNRTRIFKNGLLIVAVFAVLIGMVVVTQGTAQKSSAASDVLRQPRPHPKSHIKIADAATSIEPGIITLYPRPHPKAHLKIVEPGSILYPRPHPKSHIKLLTDQP
jgi:energy-converting hydrogenase Eha subunit F